VFYSKLICNNGEKEFAIDSRTSDAVAIALRIGCPIYIHEDILQSPDFSFDWHGDSILRALKNKPLARMFGR
jgi:bifunctional DNase/RNase